MNIIRNFYASIGYNFADIKVKRKEIDNDNLDLVFEIERGEITKISKISFLEIKKLEKKDLEILLQVKKINFGK